MGGGGSCYRQLPGRGLFSPLALLLGRAQTIGPPHPLGPSCALAGTAWGACRGGGSCLDQKRLRTARRKANTHTTTTAAMMMLMMMIADDADDDHDLDDDDDV